MATQTRSFRLRKDILDALEERAHDLGRSASALAARYIEEGLRRDEHPEITFVDRPGGRRAMIAGTRLNVAHVVATAKKARSAEATAETFDLPLQKVRAALAYYAASRDEIDAEIERDRQFAERAEARWRSEQSTLA
jgi:uncharacterized protein (DUF433 family)